MLAQTRQRDVTPHIHDELLLINRPLPHETATRGERSRPTHGDRRINLSVAVYLQRGCRPCLSFLRGSRRIHSTTSGTEDRTAAARRGTIRVISVNEAGQQAPRCHVWDTGRLSSSSSPLPSIQPDCDHEPLLINYSQLKSSCLRWWNFLENSPEKSSIIDQTFHFPVTPLMGCVAAVS